MIYLPHVEDLVKRTIEILQVGPEQLTRTSSRFSKERVLQNLNSAYASATSLGQLAMRPELIRYQNIEVDAEGVATNFAWSSTRGRVLAVTQRTGAEDTAPSEREIPLMYSRIHEGSISQQGGVSFRIINYKLHVFMKGRTGRHFRFWYLATPPPLAQASVLSYPYVNNDRIQVNSTATYGTLFPDTNFYSYALARVGWSNPSVVEITASSYSPTVPTTSVLLDVQPVGGVGGLFDDVFFFDAGSKLSIIPWFPEEFYEALCYLAATKFTKVDAALDQAPHLAQKLQEFMRFISLEDRVTPKTVVNLGNVSTGMARDTRGGLGRFG